MDKQLSPSFSSQQQQPQQQKNYEINRTMLTTADEGFYFSFIDEKDIVYTALCESEFPLKQAQVLLNRIKRELKNMPDYFRQSVNSIQTFARTFIVPIISQMDEEIGRTSNAMIGPRQRQEGNQDKQEQVQKQKQQQQRQNDGQKEKEQAQQQLRVQKQQQQQQCGEETTIIQFLENEEDDEEEAEEQKHIDEELQYEKQANLAVERHHPQQQPSKQNNEQPSKTFESSKNQAICDNDMNHTNNGLSRNRRIKTINYFKKGNTNQPTETLIISSKNEDSKTSNLQLQDVIHCQGKSQDGKFLKPQFNNNHQDLLEELPKETFASSPSENPVIFISNSSGNPGIFASTNGSYDPRKELLSSNKKINEKYECTSVQENIKITAFEDGSSKFITSTDANNKQRIKEISISQLDSSKDNNNNMLKTAKTSEKYAIFSSCREINCSIKEIDYQSSGSSQKKLSQTCSVNHPKNQEYYLDDIQIQIDKSHKFNTESSAHPSNFSTADQKQTADMLVLKQLKLKDCGIYDEEQNREDAKQHNKEEIEKMQQQQMKNAANLRSIKIKVIACILVLSVVLSIALPLIK